LGTFSATINKEIKVDEEELGLILEMTDEIAFALNSIEQENELNEFENNPA
jgi:hypothetical protein